MVVCNSDFSLARNETKYSTMHMSFLLNLGQTLAIMTINSNHNYYVYILTNPGKTVLYIGVTNSLDRRLEEHLNDFNTERKGFAAKYHCYHLIYYEWYL